MMSESSEAIASTTESVKPLSDGVKLNGNSTETKSEVPVDGKIMENDKSSLVNSPSANTEPTPDPSAPSDPLPSSVPETVTAPTSEPIESNEVPKTESSSVKDNASNEPKNEEVKVSSDAKDPQPQDTETVAKDDESKESEKAKSPIVKKPESQEIDKSKSSVSKKVESPETEKSSTEKTSRKRKLSAEKVSSNEGSDEEKVGSLEADPVIQDGVKRARKKTERLSDMIGKDRVGKEDSKNKIPEGKGVPLGEIEFVARMIKSSKIDDLRFLHLAIFGRPGNQASLRMNLKKFRGFEFEIDSAEYTTRVSKQALKKGTNADYKKALKILGLETGGTKDDLIVRLINFLVKPEETGKSKQLSSSKKKTQSKKGRKSQEKSKTTRSKSSKQSKKKDESEEESEQEDDEEETPKRAPKRSRASKGSTKKTPKKKAAPKKKSKKESEDEISDISDDDDDDDPDDEPSAKKAKKMPTDEELKQTILKLLEDVDLEKVTMKNVLQQIYEKYDGLDLTHKKEYLKSVVKDILSN